MISKKCSYLLLIIGCVLFFVYWQYQQHRYYLSPQKLTQSQKVAVNNLLSEMKPYCVGRYLIDFPSTFSIFRLSEKLDDNLWMANISKPDDSYNTYILTKKMYHPAFLQLIQRRERELKEEETVNVENMPFLKKMWTLPNDMDGVIFERNESQGANDMGRLLEGYYYSNGVVFKLQKKTTNDSSPRYEKMRDGDPIRNNVAEDVNQMQLLISRLSGRDNDVIPTKPGSCITNGFISTDTSSTDKEDISVRFASDKLDNIRLIAETDNSTREKSTVLDRASEIESNLAQSRGHVERKGTFIVNNLKVEELLATGLQGENNESRYGFDLYINEMTASYKTPNFMLSLDNEGMPPTSYSKEELITFWDTITHTIRLRPGAF